MNITKDEKKLLPESKQQKSPKRIDYGKIALIISGVMLCILSVGGGFALGRFVTGHNLRQVAQKRQGNLKDRDRDRMHKGLGEVDGRRKKGVLGKVKKIEGDNIIISTLDEDKTVITNDQTKIMKRREEIKISDIKEGDKIIVVGKPNNGSLVAKLIKVMGTKAEVGFDEETEI